MKFVTLVITAMILSFSASAQTTCGAAEKRTVVKVQQKTKSRTAKSPAQTAAREKNDVTNLKDEKAYKAKWTFEEMLQRRLEIDAEEGQQTVNRGEK